MLLAALIRQRLVIRRQRKKRKQEEEKEKAEINPVYGTYEIHDDPVAEVKHQYFKYFKISGGITMFKRF